MQVEEQIYNVEKFNSEEINAKPEDNLYPSVKNAIQKIIQTEDFTKYKVIVEAVIPDGGNYLASLYIIDIVGDTQKGTKEVNLFVKQTVCAENLYGFIDIERAYLTEVFFYTELSTIFEELQAKARIPLDQRFRNVKCCHGSGVDAIIMENLAKKGYKTPKRMEIMPLKFAQLSVIQLARLHALSFVMQKEMPDYFEKTAKNIKTVLNLNDKYIEVATKTSDIAVSHFDEDKRTEIMNDLPGLITTFFSYLNETVSSVNCICHGDYRMNNILGKEEQAEITDVVPVDYQLLFYGPPVVDLIYLLYSSSDTKFREENERDLKDLYRSSMNDFLKNFNIDVEEVFPTDVFEKDYEYMRDYGFLTSFIILPICYSDESNVIEPGTDLLKQEFKVDKKFPDRIAGLYEEYKRFKQQKYNKN